MVTNINIQLDDEDADFVRGVKDRTGETWATWIVEAAEAVEHLNRIEETAENEAFRAAKEAVESKRNRIDDVRTYDAREAAVTDDTVEDDREVIEADTNPSRPRQDDVSGEEGPSWGTDPSPDDYDRLEAEIPGEPGTLDMEQGCDDGRRGRRDRGDRLRRCDLVLVECRQGTGHLVGIRWRA